MPLPAAELATKDPSLGAVTYQAEVLVRDLSRINSYDCPLQAVRLRDLLLCIAEYVRDELVALDDTTTPKVIRGPARVLGLAKIVQSLYSCIGHLRASGHIESPPAVQVALSHLTELYLPQPQSQAVSLVVQQWDYNLGYLPLSWMLRDWLSPGVLDPTLQKLGTSSTADVIQKLWTARRTRVLADQQESDEARRLKEDPIAPSHIAVLSFAGLDTDDALVYPLLAHELGHFIDFTSDPPLHTKLAKRLAITRPAVDGILHKHHIAAGDLDRVRKEVIDRVFVCVRELFADLLATRMLGFAFFVAQAEFLKTTAPWQQPTMGPSGYPGIRLRLSVILEHLLSEDYPCDVEGFLKGAPAKHRPIAKRLLEYVSCWKGNVTGAKVPSANDGSLDADLRNLAEVPVLGAISKLHELAVKTVAGNKVPQLTPRLFERIAMLADQLPPSVENEPPHGFAEIMAAAWAYQLMHGEEREASLQTPEAKFAEYAKTSRLILKAVELIPSTRITNGAPTKPSAPKARSQDARPGVLDAREIRRRLTLPDSATGRLRTIPSTERAIKAASLELSLGNWFTIARRVRLEKFKLGNPQDDRLWASIGREEVFVQESGTFLIHPGDFVLGATLEFIALPNDVMAFVEGRSSIGRRGLLIATATQVAPGFHGVVVLELANTGTVPLSLTPGMPIAQLVLQKLTGPVDARHAYQGLFQCQTRP